MRVWSSPSSLRCLPEEELAPNQPLNLGKFISPSHTARHTMKQADCHGGIQHFQPFQIDGGADRKRAQPSMDIRCSRRQLKVLTVILKLKNRHQFGKLERARKPRSHFPGCTILISTNNLLMHLVDLDEEFSRSVA